MVNIIVSDDNLREHIGFYLWVAVDLNGNKDRPALDSGGNVGFAFCEKIHSWFIDNNIQYKLFEVDYDYTGISFKTNEDAVLFKLTWG